MPETRGRKEARMLSCKGWLGGNRNLQSPRERLLGYMDEFAMTSTENHASGLQEIKQTCLKRMLWIV